MTSTQTAPSATPAKPKKAKGRILSFLKQKVAALFPHLTATQAWEQYSANPNAMPHAWTTKSLSDVAAELQESKAFLPQAALLPKPSDPAGTTLPVLVQAAAPEVVQTTAADVEATPLEMLQKLFAESNDSSEKAQIYSVIRDMRRAPDQVTFAERFIRIAALEAEYKSERDTSKKSQLYAEIKTLRKTQ
jgi:hypothetical protein